MGYIIKKGTTGGGGDATAANQTTQIGIEQKITDQLAEGSVYPSVLKDATDLSVFKDVSDLSNFLDGRRKSVFKDANSDSVFTDLNDTSVFASNTNDSLFYKSINNQITGSRTNQMQVQLFTAATSLGVQALLQNFLNVTDCYVVSLTAAHSIGQFDLFLLYST
jgi:hypothetical protein